jgi:hypothetical protein
MRRLRSKDLNDASFPENVAEDEKVPEMTLKSADDDLRQRTIARIPGIWGKLKYVAGLRSAKGGYVHWGFERVHGPAAAQDAFKAVHKTLVKTILQTRLSALREDLEQSSEADAISPTSYASTLVGSRSQLLPSGSPREAELHLFSVLETLSLLAVHKREGSQSS